MDEMLGDRRLAPPARYGELDLALEWGEDIVLCRCELPGELRAEPRHIPLVQHPAMHGLPPPAVERFAAVLSGASSIRARRWCATANQRRSCTS